MPLGSDYAGLYVNTSASRTCDRWSTTSSFGVLLRTPPMMSADRARYFRHCEGQRPEAISQWCR